MADRVICNMEDLVAIADVVRGRTGQTKKYSASQLREYFEGELTEGAVILPKLYNPASPSEILSGYEAVDGTGAKIAGTFTKDDIVYVPYKDAGVYPLEALTSIGQLNFKENATLTGINIPNITTLETYTFSSCTALETVVLPAATSIPAYCFSHCSALKRVDLTAVTSFGGMAFGNCTSLNTLIIRSETLVPLGSTNIFTDTPIANKAGYIYVPRALLESYKTATNWSTFASQIRAIEDYNGITWESFTQEKPLSTNLSASSQASSFPVTRLVDGKTSYDPGSWETAQNVTEAWVKIDMQYPVRNITAHLWNRDERLNNPIAGRIEGSHTGEDDWVTLTTFSDRSGDVATLLTDHQCNNTEAYRYIRLFFTEWAKFSQYYTYCTLGEIAISGERQVGFEV